MKPSPSAARALTAGWLPGLTEADGQSELGTTGCRNVPGNDKLRHQNIASEVPMASGTAPALRTSG